MAPIVVILGVILALVEYAFFAIIPALIVSVAFGVAFVKVWTVAFLVIWVVAIILHQLSN